MTRRASILLALVALSVLLTAVPTRAEPASKTFEYLYVEANDGDSSGGHAAICFDVDCYHYQHDAGFIRLNKDSAARLDHIYRALGNRSVHATRVSTSADTYGLLADAFAQAYRVQSRQFEIAAALAADSELIDALRARLAGIADPASLTLPATAYLFADQPDPLVSAAHDPGIAALRARIDVAHGRAALVRRMAALRAELAQLSPSLDEPSVPPTIGGELTRSWEGFAERYRDIVSGMLAVAALQIAPPLRIDTTLSPNDAAFALDAAERQAISRRAAALERSLAELFDSQRPDWGYPMLVGIARLLALRASATTGRLVLLDTYAANPEVLPADTIARHAGALAALLQERRNDFVAARAAFFAHAPSHEYSLSQLEGTGNVYGELAGALGDHMGLRVHSGSWVPQKSARRHDWPVPPLSSALLDRAADAARQRESRYRADLETLYAYNVVERNCVTEIFRTIDSAVGSSDNRLGGHVAIGGTLNFIPFLSAEAVRHSYRVTETTEYPSLRRLAVADMQRQEHSMIVSLREATVLTANAYSSQAHDPIFLFFTDDHALPRPLFGAVNLAVGLGATVVGAATLPFDGGTLLGRGLNGILFSLPELAFVNLRKGSYPFVPRHWPGARTFTGEASHQQGAGVQAE